MANQMAACNDSTIFALTTRRWLAAYFGVDGESDALSAARRAAFEADPASYVSGLMGDQNIVAVIGDEGYPQPPVTRAEFEKNLGVPVYRVARIEPWIAELQDEQLSYADFEAAFEQRLEETARDPLTVGYKSVIGYRTGLDVTDPSPIEAAAAYDAWRAAGWPKDRGPARPSGTIYCVAHCGPHGGTIFRSTFIAALATQRTSSRMRAPRTSTRFCRTTWTSQSCSFTPAGRGSTRRPTSPQSCHSCTWSSRRSCRGPPWA